MSNIYSIHLIPVGICIFKSWSGSQVQGLLLTEHAPVCHSEDFELFHKYNREPWKDCKLWNDTIVSMLYYVEAYETVFFFLLVKNSEIAISFGST